MPLGPPTRIHLRLAAALICLLGTATGCMQWEVQQRTLDAYIAAIQERDVEAGFRLMSPELRASIAQALGTEDDGGSGDNPFGVTLEELHRQFERQRQEGEITFSAEGIALIRALGLGRGAFYNADHALSVSNAERARMIVRVVLPYNLIDRPDQARRGDVFWRLGRPFGHIYPILHGMPYMGEQEELLCMRVRVDLVACAAAEPPSPTGWCVHALAPLAETAEYQTVRYTTGMP